MRGVSAASMAAYTSSSTSAVLGVRVVRVHAVDQAVGVQGVVDGVSLAQELGVPQQVGVGLAASRRAARPSAVPTGTVDLPATRSPG